MSVKEKFIEPIKMKADDPIVIVSGLTMKVDFRILSETNYQKLKSAYDKACDGKKQPDTTSKCNKQNVNGWAYLYDNAKPIMIGFIASMLLSTTYKLIETIIIKIALIVNGS